MFNFKALTLIHPEEDGSLSSFVGIRRNNNGVLEFRLPRGFSEFPVDDFEQVKRLFFRLYRTFKKFERDSTRDILDQRPVGKDNTAKENNGYRFKDKEDNEVILYSKIALIENLLEVYRDLALDVIERRIGQDERIDYSKIEHYLHRAIYLDKHVIFIDEMDLPRQTLHYQAMTLIDLFCFILSELQTELEQEPEPRVQELAQRFSQQHLNHDQSLFNEETFETTIQTLKDILNEIDKTTAYKDEYYWQLYEAIELFLYGELDMEKPHEDGTYWGINNFSSVWEDMCATWAFSKFSDLNHSIFNIVYADTNIVFNGKRVANAKSAGYFPIYKKEDFDDPFFIEFRGKKRWMRPDLVLIFNNTSGQRNLFDVFRMFDWKYMDESCFMGCINKKVETDTIKQLCYDFSLQKSNSNDSCIIQNDFFIPWFKAKNQKNYKSLHLIKHNGIGISKGNFMKIQAVYLSHD